MIYTIKAGDTLYQIANQFNTTIEALVQANGLTRPNDLAIGQNIFIPTTTPTTTYTVQAGDTLFNIAQRYNITLDSLIAANPNITNPNFITIGQVINIPDNRPLIEVNGYAVANISEMTLDRTLPYLTYLSIFSYQAKADGSMYILYEDNLINRARQASVAPIMVVTNIGDSGGFDSDIAHTVYRSGILIRMEAGNLAKPRARVKNHGIGKLGCLIN